MRQIHRQGTRNDIGVGRVSFLAVVIAISFTAIIVRLFFVQVIAHEKYKELADRQHLRKADYVAERGEIFAQDHTYDDGNELYPLAVNKEFFEIYLNPSEIRRPINTADILSQTLDVSYEEMLARAQKENRQYEPVTARATEEQVALIKAAGLTGIHFRPQIWRYYPDKEVGSHILGFYGLADESFAGKYGTEGFWQRELAGINQEVLIARDGTGSIIPDSDEYFNLAIDGADIVLTIDRTVQFEVCRQLQLAIDQYAADSGTVIVMESQSGAIRAMCNYPSFDPNDYGNVEDISWFNNRAVFEAYEPGSVFKPITMAIAIDQGKVTPTTIYEDTGELKFADFTVRNFDKKAHGIKTMTDVLQQSLNLGAIFATEEVSNQAFYNYIKKFGFGEKTGINISQEVAGDLGKLSRKKDIYKATASYGQGLTVTPLQMLVGFNVIANEGVLVKPYIVDELRHSTGNTDKFAAKNVRQVISRDTAQTVTAMLVKVIEEGYDSRGSVDGHYLAGKTGTAQIAESGRYIDKTNHTFVGYGPATDPIFSILIKLHNVKNVKFAADSTLGSFRNIAQFLLQYYKIPPSK